MARKESCKNFEIGDTVSVKFGLSEGSYSNLYFNESMNKYAGMVYTVSGYSIYGYYKLIGYNGDDPCIDGYSLSRWDWNDDMLEPAIMCDNSSCELANEDDINNLLFS